jgi:hypothetical protein
VLLAVVVLTGCPLRLRVDSRPAGALVELPNGKVVSTPAIANVVWFPLVRQRLVVHAPGYRDLNVGLKSNGVSTRRVVSGVLHPFAWIREEPRYALDFVLVPEHGAAGEWTPDGEGLVP